MGVKILEICCDLINSIIIIIFYVCIIILYVNLYTKLIYNLQAVIELLVII